MAPKYSAKRQALQKFQLSSGWRTTVTEAEVLQILKKCGALLDGHFLLTSGRHSDRYIEKFRLLERPDVTEQPCRELAARFEESRVETVLGPAVGGIVLAYEIARHLGARAVFAERLEGLLTLRRGFVLKPNERVLVVEDVVTTGGSIREILAIAQGSGAKVVGTAVLTSRADTELELDVRTEVLLRLSLESYPARNCPLCQKGITLRKPGSRTTEEVT